MSNTLPIRRAQADWPPRSSSPLRANSNASTTSTVYTTYSGQFAPSRTSTVSSTASNGSSLKQLVQTRTMNEISEKVSNENEAMNKPNDPSDAYKSIRKSLRPTTPVSPPESPKRKLLTRPVLSHLRGQSVDSVALQLTPSIVPGSKNPSPTSAGRSMLSHLRGQSVDSVALHQNDGTHYSANVPSARDSITLGRAESINPGRNLLHHAHPALPPTLTAPELQDLQKSSTPHLKNLSRLAQSGEDEELTLISPIVVGLQGRRQLKRNDSVRGSKGNGTAKNRHKYSWNGNWMDKQRQFLQAYEYLCHIGEAKEWIEDIIQKAIPPIVQLEEALRDGITLAEIVQSLNPEKTYRIFRNPKLQYRHSDNIAIFFRYLAEVELPDLFRFELIDLYEKKNIPKVIYCIHALSWLLFRKGIVDFRIGNLVGQLQFEHHELEEMQKGLDKSGVSMPSFAGVGASFGEPEPEPEPETEEERVARELGECEDAITDLQAQIRGAMVRLRLTDIMQTLWDAEEMLIDLQSRIRADWARQVFDYRLGMKSFAANLQSAARGFLSRSKYQKQQATWKAEEDKILQLQSLFRASKARQNVQYIKSKMQRQDNGIKEFQAAIRGAFERKRIAEEQQATKVAEPQLEYFQAAVRGALERKRLAKEQQATKAASSEVEQLQAAIRGALKRGKLEAQHSQIKNAESEVTCLQAAIRGAMQRIKLDAQYQATLNTEADIADFQAAVRGMLQRREIKNQQTYLKMQQPAISQLQAFARAMIKRRHVGGLMSKLYGYSDAWTALEAISRACLLRKKISHLKDKLQTCEGSITALQAILRARKVQKDYREVNGELNSHEKSVLLLQSHIRGFLFRRNYLADLHALQNQTQEIIDLQSHIRGYILRQDRNDFLSDLRVHEQEVTSIQALARAMAVRIDVGNLLARLDEEEQTVVELQALARGSMVRVKFLEKQRYFEENMQKVIKLQSFVRARQQGEAYKSLTSGKNPPVSTIKNFVHLLNDSDFDFEEELQFERLRKTVVQHVRQNELADQYIQQLDIKIALLVKNKITLDEIIKHQKHFGGHVSNLLTNTEINSKDPFDLKALNKNSRRKLEHYQELFFMLQTQPQYLSRWFRRLREKTTSEKECERIRYLMMGLFGYAQKRREEYYLLKLISRSIWEEIEHCHDMQDYLRGNFFWIKLFGAYTKSPRDRKYMRDFLGPIIRQSILENNHLDLESDPLQIYQKSLHNEELRTGQRSRRRTDVSREEAIKDPETRDIFVNNLRDLRDIVDQFYGSFEDLLPRLPYGVRYIAQQMFHYLCSKFQGEDQAYLLQIVGQWVWRYYLQPALLEPEKHGVVDRGLSAEHRRNLGEVVKVIAQISSARLFGPENIFLQPLNSFVEESIVRTGEIWEQVISVQSAESYFDIDEFNDLYAKTKPTLYIKMGDIFLIHQLLIQDMGPVCPNQDDVLREVVRELGSAKTNETEMMAVGSSEICLTLSPKYHNIEDPDAEVKALFMETKRCALYIIRVQQGTNLMEIMVKPITGEDEDKWEQIIRDELSTNNRKKAAYSEANPVLDIASMSYADLKRTALENILQLEKFGRLTRKNNYQDLLNAIAIDIRTKHRRRIQRQRELEGVRLTLVRLKDQAVYLDQQLKTYNDYIEQAMVTLQNKKGKKRFLMPFTKQWDHERELQRSGRVVKFGSYKYSARNLSDKGVLVHWLGYTEKQWDKVDLTISSNEIGVFTVEGSTGNIQIPGASAQIPLDDLLQAQFNNTQFMDFFRGELRVNVNLFLHLIMRKFYND